eukprot:jgi/Phyca11/99472/e_gw1.3.521.1
MSASSRASVVVARVPVTVPVPTVVVWTAVGASADALFVNTAICGAVTARTAPVTIPAVLIALPSLRNAALPSRGRTIALTAAGARDRASATTFVDPGLYSILKSYSWSVRDQR